MDPMNPDLVVGGRIRIDDERIEFGTIIAVRPGEIDVKMDSGEIAEIDTTPLQSRVFTVLN